MSFDPVADHNDFVVIVGDREMRDVDWVLPQEWVDQIRTGYRCWNCKRQFEIPWPKHCPDEACRFPVGRLQAEMFAASYRGTEQFHNTPQTGDR